MAKTKKATKKAPADSINKSNHSMNPGKSSREESFILQHLQCVEIMIDRCNTHHDREGIWFNRTGCDDLTLIGIDFSGCQFFQRRIKRRLLDMWNQLWENRRSKLLTIAVHSTHRLAIIFSGIALTVTYTG